MANYETSIVSKSSCRICLNKHSFNVKIQGKQQVLFEDCIGDSVTNGSTLLCFDCAKKLEDFNQFKAIALKANKLWNSGVYSFVKEEIKVENETDSEDHHKDEKECTSLSEENDSSNNHSEEKHLFNLEKNIKFESYNNLKKNKCKPLGGNIEHKSKYECGLCNFKSSDDSMGAINNHVAEHFANNQLNCQLCEFKGFDFAEMESHRFIHQSQIKSMWCHICQKKTISKPALIFHFRTKHISQNNDCACRYCNKTYRTYRKWKVHEKCHTQPEKFKCDICKKGFKRKSPLKAHIIGTHLKIGCICYICGKKVGRLQYLETHIRMVHDPTHQPIKCSHCNRVFKSQAHLKIHKSRINKPTFTCPHCPKVFNDKSYRNQHILFHTELRPFQCTLCESSYKVKSMLTIHMRKHTGERPYVCSTCGKGFATSYQLKRHMGMHTGKKGKQCLYCDKSFYSINLLNAHMLKTHANNAQKGK